MSTGDMAEESYRKTKAHRPPRRGLSLTHTASTCPCATGEVVAATGPASPCGESL